MKHTMHRSIAVIFAALLLSASNAFAEKVPNYTVELIVFENHALKGWTEEQWPDEIELPNTNKSTSVFTRGKSPLWISKAERELGNVAARMKRSKGYRILFHQAWSQNTYADLKMPQLLIEAAHDNTQMAGTVKLYKSRYAHVDFDLRFERRIPDRIKTLFFEQQKITPFDIEPESWQFELRESRKIRPNQLHYIDHPLFGILVQLRYNGPAEEVAPTTAAR